MNTQFQPVTPENFTRVNSDNSGNERYIISFRKLLSVSDFNSMSRNGSIDATYKLTCKRVNQIGGRKYTASKFGGLIVFKCDSLTNLCQRINEHFSK